MSRKPRARVLLSAMLPLLMMPAAALAQSSPFPPVSAPASAPPAAAPAAPEAPAPRARRAKPVQSGIIDERFGNDDQFQPGGAPAAPAPKKKARSASAPGIGRTAVACTGAFAKGSSHLRLAQEFDSRNLAYAEVDGPDGDKQMASVLFGNTPKRRLEVWWQDDASRSDIAIIVINGQSQWSAPKGVKLGMPLAAIEKLNGRPFKLSGLGKDNRSAVTDWQGGVLAAMPGGCKLSLRFEPAHAEPDIAGEKELLSSDAAVKSAQLKIGEILIGY